MRRWEWRLLCALTFASLAIHYHFRIRGFGEQDEARIALYALDWRTHGAFASDTYLNRTSPLYLLLLRFALEHGLSGVGIADALNVVNVACGSLALVPMFLLFRLLTGDAAAAFFAVGAYWFAPAFWYGQGYGMPHIPALACFLTSLYAFARALGASEDATSTRTRGRTWWLVVAGVASGIAGALKSDTVLAGLAFPALVGCLAPVTLRALVMSCMLPAFGVLTALVTSRLFLPVPVSAVAFATEWNRQFPFDLRALVDGGHWNITWRALGAVFWLAAAVGLWGCMARLGRTDQQVRRSRRLALLAAAWALPTVVFWGMIWAHAARHLATALVPVSLVTVVGLRALLGSVPRTALALAALLVSNYFSAGATNHPHLATPRLFASRDLMQALTDHFMKSGADFSNARAERKLLLGGGAVPYCEFAVIAGAERVTRRVASPGELWELDVLGPERRELVRIRRGPQPTPEREDGRWFVWNAELGAPP